MPKAEPKAEVKVEPLKPAPPTKVWNLDEEMAKEAGVAPPKPAPAPPPVPKPEPKVAEAKPEPKPAAPAPVTKPVPMPPPAEGPKPPKQVAKPEAKPEPKAEPKPEPKKEPTVESRTQAGPDKVKRARGSKCLTGPEFDEAAHIQKAKESPEAWKALLSARLRKSLRCSHPCLKEGQINQLVACVDWSKHPASDRPEALDTPQTCDGDAWTGQSILALATTLQAGNSCGQLGKPSTKWQQSGRRTSKESGSGSGAAASQANQAGAVLSP